MPRVVSNNTFICVLSADMVFLLLIDMSNLEPDVRMGERTWRIAQDTVKAAEGFVVFALLLVDYAETEKNLVCLVKI
jgi:hypothetical protein